MLAMARFLIWMLTIGVVARGGLAQEQGSSAGADPASADPALPAPADSTQSHDSQTVLQLIDQLNSANYEKRETADSALREIGTDAIDPLKSVFKESDDFETRLRIQRIAEHIYFWDRVIGQNGFLGISHRRYADTEDPRLEPDTAAFTIANVIEDTAAERNGLKIGDLIIAIDGVTLPASASASDFADQIRTKKPGAIMTFDFFRGKELMTITLAIGHRPPALYLNRRATPDLKEQYDDAIRAFPGWWTGNFDTEPFLPAQEYLPVESSAALRDFPPAVPEDD